ncbi:hypothetical protein [Pseudolactococcus hodotermopsidis]|uniref:hypothetical protein n=1 Tax=Pseudolactococcus hodotermopsidis TaxID=2709157 RepID=UPI001551CA31|nr:hypothetical protein [Lactococcus hodotermopsidis]
MPSTTSKNSCSVKRNQIAILLSLLGFSVFLNVLISFADNNMADKRIEVFLWNAAALKEQRIHRITPRAALQFPPQK